MFGHVHHHLSKKVDKEIAIALSLCILFLGIGLGYAVYETNVGLSNAVWIPVSSNITYTYAMQAKGGKASASFSPTFLVTASYKYTSADGVSHQGFDDTTTGEAPLNMQPTTEVGTVYYDQKDPVISHVFPLGSGSGFIAWFAVGFLIIMGILTLIGSLT